MRRPLLSFHVRTNCASLAAMHRISWLGLAIGIVAGCASGAQDPVPSSPGVQAPSIMGASGAATPTAGSASQAGGGAAPAMPGAMIGNVAGTGAVMGPSTGGGAGSGMVALPQAGGAGPAMGAGGTLAMPPPMPMRHPFAGVPRMPQPEALRGESASSWGPLKRVTSRSRRRRGAHHARLAQAVVPRPEHVNPPPAPDPSALRALDRRRF